MEQILIKIETINAAFGEDIDSANLELASILEKLASDLKAGVQSTHLRDTNGNVVGFVSYTLDGE